MRTPQRMMDGWFQSRRIMRLDVVDGKVFPCLVADVLPTGNLLEHQQSDLIAGIEEMARLRIVRGADDIALQVLAQNDGVTALDAGRHGLADPREGLMAIQAAQLDDRAVELESFGVNFASRKPMRRESLSRMCCHAAVALPRDRVWALRIPEIDCAEVVELDSVRDESRWSVDGNCWAALSDELVAVAEERPQGQPVVPCELSRALEEAVHIERRLPESTSMGWAKMFSMNVGGTRRSETSR